MVFTVNEILVLDNWQLVVPGTLRVPSVQKISNNAQQAASKPKLKFRLQ